MLLLLYIWLYNILIGGICLYSSASNIKLDHTGSILHVPRAQTTEEQAGSCSLWYSLNLTQCLAQNIASVYLGKLIIHLIKTHKRQCPFFFHSHCHFP